jgi:hypothetical protein
MRKPGIRAELYQCSRKWHGRLLEWDANPHSIRATKNKDEAPIGAATRISIRSKAETEHSFWVVIKPSNH